MTCITMDIRRVGFAESRSDWDRLLGSAGCPHIFLTRAWQEAWWRRFGGGSTELSLLAFHDGDGPVAIAPLMKRSRRVGLIGTPDLFDYHDLLVRRGQGASVIHELLAQLGGQRDWDVLDFESIPEWSELLEVLPDACRRRGWQVAIEEEDVAPALDLPDDWPTYLAGLSKKNRHELRRKLRRLERSGIVDHEIHRTRESIESHLDDFVRLHKVSSPEKRAFLTPEREAFFREVALSLAESGSTRLAILRLEGRPVATSLCFQFRDEKFVYNSGFDPDYASLSIGLANHAYVLQRSIEEKVRRVHFLRGDERYKYHLGAVDRTLYRIQVYRAPE